MGQKKAKIMLTYHRDGPQVSMKMGNSSIAPQARADATPSTGGGQHFGLGL